MYNAFVGRMSEGDLWDGLGFVRLRAIKIGRPIIARRLYIDEVVREMSNIFIHNLEDRRTNIFGSALEVSGAHHVG